MKTDLPRIVCGTDFSQNSQGAALVAAAFAVAFKAKLELVHISEDTTLYGQAEAELEKALEPTRRKLQLEADRLRANGADVDEVLQIAPLADRRLVEMMEAHPPLLAVVSSVSKTVVERWTLGSVSEYLAQNSPCPVLVVRNPATLLAWLKESAPLNVFTAVDFTDTSDRVLHWLAKLRSLNACTIMAGHVNWPPQDAKRLGESRSISLVANSPRVQRTLLAELTKKIDAIPGLGEIGLKVAPNWGRPDSALVMMAKDALADLVVVGAHQRHGWARAGRPSVSEGILRHSIANVLCVPACVRSEQKSAVPIYRRVLVATDFSPLGNAAIPHAYAGMLAGGEVRLIHVIPPSHPPSPLIPRYERKPYTKEKLRELARESRAKLRDLVPEVARERGIVSECAVVTHDDPARAIVESAERFGADLICLGSHGRGNVAEAILGSVAHAVIKESRRPVLVIRPPQA